MRRTKELQKAHLLGGLSSVKKKKVLATRGSRVLVENYKKTEINNSSFSILPFMGIWLVICISLWFVFLASILSLILIAVPGLTLIYLVKKFFIKENSYQLINKVENKVDLKQMVEEHEHLFSQEIKDALEQVMNNLEYLKPFADQKQLGSEQEHYVEQCRNKHLPDLIKSLDESHQDNLPSNQENVLMQINGLNDKLKRIIASIQQDIDLNIKVKSVHTKDR